MVSVHARALPALMPGDTVPSAEPNWPPMANDGLGPAWWSLLSRTTNTWSFVKVRVHGSGRVTLRSRQFLWRIQSQRNWPAPTLPDGTFCLSPPPPTSPFTNMSLPVSRSKTTLTRPHVHGDNVGRLPTESAHSQCHRRRQSSTATHLRRSGLVRKPLTLHRMPAHPLLYS